MGERLFLVLVAGNLAVACAASVPRHPPVYVVSVGFSPSEMRLVWEGASEWRKVGFQIRRYGEPAQDGDRIVTVYRAALRARSGQATIAGDVIELDHRLEGEHLIRVAAHEVGHLLLWGSGHLPDGMGIMSAWPVGDGLSPADFALACLVAKAGC